MIGLFEIFTSRFAVKSPIFHPSQGALQDLREGCSPRPASARRTNGLRPQNPSVEATSPGWNPDESWRKTNESNMPTPFVEKHTNTHETRLLCVFLDNIQPKSSNNYSSLFWTRLIWFTSKHLGITTFLRWLDHGVHDCFTQVFWHFPGGSLRIPNESTFWVFVRRGRQGCMAAGSSCQNPWSSGTLLKTLNAWTIQLPLPHNLTKCRQTRVNILHWLHWVSANKYISRDSVTSTHDYNTSKANRTRHLFLCSEVPIEREEFFIA